MPMLAAFVVRDNLRNRRTIQRAYLQAMGHAKKRVLLANPISRPATSSARRWRWRPSAGSRSAC
jgi:hypothetical protein